MLLLSIMILLALAVFGLIFGSFVNALVWRLYMQDRSSRGKSKNKLLPPKDEISLTRGRSMCPDCRHPLAAKDLVPVFSWLYLKGKCRYCQKPISIQYPLVELLTAVLFVASYIFWPEVPLSNFNSSLNFIIWLIFIVGFMALIVYDLKWMLLPNRIIYPLIILAGILAVFNIVNLGGHTGLNTIYSVLIAGGIFFSLFQLSGGRWIGGGDVKLGLLIGLILAEPYLAFLMLLTASGLGTLLVLPGLLTKKLTSNSRIPFGPFLILGCILVKLFGASAIAWYKKLLVV